MGKRKVPDVVNRSICALACTDAMSLGFRAEITSCVKCDEPFFAAPLNDVIRSYPCLGGHPGWKSDTLQEYSILTHCTK